jgi:ribosome-binding factor A
MAWFNDDDDDDELRRRRRIEQQRADEQQFHDDAEEEAYRLWLQCQSERKAEYSPEHTPLPTEPHKEHRDIRKWTPHRCGACKKNKPCKRCMPPASSTARLPKTGAKIVAKIVGDDEGTAATSIDYVQKLHPGKKKRCGVGQQQRPGKTKQCGVGDVVVAPSGFASDNGNECLPYSSARGNRVYQQNKAAVAKKAKETVKGELSVLTTTIEEVRTSKDVAISAMRIASDRDTREKSRQEVKTANTKLAELRHRERGIARRLRRLTYPK